MPKNIATTSTAYVPTSSCRLRAYLIPSRIPRRLGRSAFSDGGTARIMARATSEKRKVTMSRPYVAGSPIVAIRTPAIAGPPIVPTFMRSESSALAAGSSSRETRRGVSASSDGR